MIYKICYLLFVSSFAFGIWGDGNYKISKIRTLQFLIIVIGLVGQIIGIID